ncbi:MAG TPA: hypothetical protein VGN27_14350 [Gaiellaceae bacterium]|jgi:hypothetical protein|nr:hypothetical protein [Gaiellaceae bacterium]
MHALALALVAAVSGLHGIVTRGPTHPVCQVGTPCTAPAVGTVLVFSRSGHAPVKVRIGAGGRYSARLAAGYYAVSTSPPARIGGIKPREVRVRAGVDGHLDFRIDTGIR